VRSPPGHTTVEWRLAPTDPDPEFLQATPGRAVSRERMRPAIEGEALGRGASRRPTDLSKAFDNDNRPTRPGDDGGRRQPGEPAPDNDDICAEVPHANSTAQPAEM